jgi:hypothetical protein
MSVILSEAAWPRSRRICGFHVGCRVPHISTSRCGFIRTKIEPPGPNPTIRSSLKNCHPERRRSRSRRICGRKRQEGQWPIHGAHRDMSGFERSSVPTSDAPETPQAGVIPKQSFTGRVLEGFQGSTRSGSRGGNLQKAARKKPLLLS